MYVLETQEFENEVQFLFSTALSKLVIQVISVIIAIKSGV